MNNRYIRRYSDGTIMSDADVRAIRLIDRVLLDVAFFIAICLGTLVS